MKQKVMMHFDLKHSDAISELIKKLSYFNNVRLAYTLKVKPPIQFRFEVGV